MTLKIPLSPDNLKVKDGQQSSTAILLRAWLISLCIIVQKALYIYFFFFKYIYLSWTVQFSKQLVFVVVRCMYAVY